MVDNNQTKQDIDSVSRLYASLDCEIHNQGLNFDEVNKLVNLCYWSGIKYFVDDAACKPTGLALGCPLPDKNITNQLWQMANSFNSYLFSLSNYKDKNFAFVPPELYHITVINRSHFDISEVIVTISEAEKQKIQIIINQVVRGTIKIQLKGLILTSSGRLIVSGFPLDKILFLLRAKLTQLLPDLCIHTPPIATIKLGHILVPLDFEKTEQLLQWITQCRENIDAVLSFSDFYTPVGRITNGTI